MTESRRRSALIPVLTFTTMVVAIISSLGAPLLPSISNDLHVPLSTAQWSLTATLLVGAVSAPIMGRLGDGPHRREAMIGGLGLVTLGGVLAALAPSLALLVAGRALQGVGLGLVPLTMAAARDDLPREKIHSTIALLSVCVAAGVGIGYPVSGLIADALGPLGGVLVRGVRQRPCTALRGRRRAVERRSCIGRARRARRRTPHRGPRGAAPADRRGQLWGWSSPEVIGLLAAAALILVGWVFQQLRASAPLVELRLLRHPAVLTGDGCAIVLGVAMYMYMSGVTEYVQAPRPADTGSRRRSWSPGSASCRSPSPASWPAGRCRGSPRRFGDARAPAGRLARGRARRRLLRALPHLPVAGVRDDGDPRRRASARRRRRSPASSCGRCPRARRAAPWASTRSCATSASRWEAR